MTFSIDIKNVSMQFGKFTALDQITLQLEEGKIYGLLGRNGAGKSTLLSLLASFSEPTKGTIQIGGETPFENSKVMSEVTFVYETDYSDETETVKGFLEGIERYRPHYDPDYAMKLLKLFKLSLDKQVYKLSSGKKSALNAIIGLASRSKITIFDEVYNGMDAPTREKFYKEVLADYERFPRTIILSTHLVSEMDYLFEEVIILKDGKMLLHEPIDQLLEKGMTVTGSKDDVDEFTHQMKTGKSQVLGGTKAVTVYEEMTESKQAQANALHLELSPVSLQDLFIFLTEEEEHEGN